MLDKHERLVHHKERPFSCHLCNKRFGQKVHLDVHISGVHLKERPYGNCLYPFLNNLLKVLKERLQLTLIEF